MEITAIRFIFDSDRTWMEVRAIATDDDPFSVSGIYVKGFPIDRSAAELLPLVAGPFLTWPKGTIEEAR